MDHEFTDVVEHLRSHAGETLQAVLIYEGDRHRDLYRREDITELHDSPLEAELLAEIRSDRKERETALAGQFEGTHRATVRVFDSRVVLHLPRDADSGAVVLLDPAAARNLVEFVSDIRADIYGE